jgi:hypothetical protein
MIQPGVVVCAVVDVVVVDNAVDVDDSEGDGVPGDSTLLGNAVHVIDGGSEAVADWLTPCVGSVTPDVDGSGVCVADADALVFVACDVDVMGSVPAFVVTVVDGETDDDTVVESVCELTCAVVVVDAEVARDVTLLDKSDEVT